METVSCQLLLCFAFWVRDVYKGSWTNSSILLHSVPICNSFSAHSKAWTNECAEDTQSKNKTKFRKLVKRCFSWQPKGAWTATGRCLVSEGTVLPALADGHQWARGRARGKTETHSWEWERCVGKPHLRSVPEERAAGYVSCVAWGCAALGLCFPLGSADNWNVF